jgi:hypothetical protein
VADAAEAVHIVHTGKSISCHAYIWMNAHGQRVALIDDSCIDDPWGEVAVVNLDTKEQYESLTFGWIESEALKLALVMSAVTNATVWRPAIVPLDGSLADRKCNFLCGCCGEVFKSTFGEQKVFDQDEGYGICGRCIERSGRQAFPGGEPQVIDACQGRNIWNNDGTDGPCLICAPPTNEPASSPATP